LYRLFIYIQTKTNHKKEIEMKNRHILTSGLVTAVLLILITSLSIAHPTLQEATVTAFTYQGQLQEKGFPVNGTCNFIFELWNVESGGTAALESLSIDDISLTDGIFTVQLNFDLRYFEGDARWLAIQVDCEGSGAFETLSPRQPLTATPYAFYSLKVPWTGITGIPADIADGDDDTIYTAGDGLVLSSGNVFSADTSYLQKRVAGTCPLGSSIRVIDANGNVTCEPDDNTIYTAGNGLSLKEGSFLINPTYTQRRVTGTCEAGAGITLVNQDGTVECEAYSDTSWSLSGNAGTTSSHFLGTTDDQGLHFKVNGQDALRLEPHATSPNLVGGNSLNIMASDVYGGTIGGGGTSGNPNAVYAHYGTVSGGLGNTAGVLGSPTTTMYATVGGGVDNTASEQYATVAGGNNNTASGDYASVGGGSFNVASGDFAMIPGGSGNEAVGKYSFAAGRLATANQDGCFTWADSTTTTLLSCDTPNAWVARATGGVTFYTSAGHGSGVTVTAGGGAWATVSDRNLKENFEDVDSRALLETLADIPISTWNYISQDDAIRHIGPVAQDFYAAFGVGENDTSISTVDADGVALAAIQGLYAENQDLKARIDDLEARLSALEQGSQTAQTGQTQLSLQSPWIFVLGMAVVSGIWITQRKQGGKR
jgi:trimeric autotransporter adhesin